MADFETIELDPSTKDAAFHKSDYAQVIFNNIAEIYSTSGDIECNYTITPSLVPDTRDWVGLYKVGWRSARDYVYFEWATVPKDPNPGTEIHNVVVFKGKNLPKDDGEFYQFCYVTNSGHVRGASTPFQFKRPLAEEYVEVEAEDGELLVVKTRTAVMQERLQQASQQREKLTKDMELLEQERDSLLSKLVEMQKQLAAESDEKKALQNSVKDHQEQMQAVSREAKDMQLAHDGLRDKITVLNQEKEAMEKRLDDNDVYLRSLQEKIKALINEKDALTGKNKALEEEKALFKNHFTSSESTITCYLQEKDRMKTQLEASEATCSKIRADVDRISSDLHSEKTKAKGQAKVMEADKEHIAGLEERARNAEDKLKAAEHCKILLNDEVLNVQEVCKKVSADLESSRSEAHVLKTQLSQQEGVYTAESTKLSSELTRCHHQLEDTQMEKKELETELARIKSQMRDLEENQHSEEAGPLFALQLAQTNLKERYVKMKSLNEDLKREMKDLTRKLVHNEESEQGLKREVQDLRERLTMGQDEYKAQFIQCRRLQAQLRKLQRQGSKSEGSSGPQDDFVEVQVEVVTSDAGTECEAKVTSDAGTYCEAKATTDAGTDAEAKATTDAGTDAEAKVTSDAGTDAEVKVTSDTGTDTENTPRMTVCTLTDTSETGEKEIQTEMEAAVAMAMGMGEEPADLTTTELQTQLDDLGRELQNLTAKKHKYKQLLQEEKEKNQFLQRHYYDELQKRDEELGRLRDHLSGSPAKEVQRKKPVPPPALYPNPYSAYTPTPSAPPPPQDVKEFDPLREEGLGEGLPKPLRPLPPPMTPEMTQGAKVAAIKARQNGGVGLNGIMDMCNSLSEESPQADTERKEAVVAETSEAPQIDTDETDASPAPLPREAPPTRDTDTRIEIEGEEETEFVDAQGEPQKMCPICTMTFPSETSDMVVSDHIDDHYGPVCPICHRQFEKGTEQFHFQEHVEGHFD